MGPKVTRVNLCVGPFSTSHYSDGFYPQGLERTTRGTKRDSHLRVYGVSYTIRLLLCSRRVRPGRIP